MRLFLLLTALAAALAQNPAPVPAQDARNANIPNTDTHFTMPAYPNLAAWEARKLVLKRQILFAAGLDPMPEKSPLHPQVFGRTDAKDYTIDKVLLETLPGYYLGGNLYRPKGRTGKFPAIASPHGHWNYGRLEHAPLNSIPTRCINLARQGYVVLAYDMVGYNDTAQTPHAFGGRSEQLWGFGPLGLQLWNSIRVVDFLASLDEVDAARIGATGASGGGTQTFLLAAVDDRIQFDAPVNMVSAIMQGGSPCENAPGLRVGAFNVEFAAMMAPRPMLLVSATGDWTRNMLKEEHPAIRHIYELYDRVANVEAVQIDAPHNYNQASREAVYRFFARKVLGDDDQARYKEQSVRVEKLQDMLALHGRTLPAGALNYDGLFTQWKRNAGRQLEAIQDKATRKRLLQQAVGAEWPAQVVDQTTGDRIVLSRPGVGDRVPGLWFPGKGKPVLVVHELGAQAALPGAELAKARAAGRPVLAIDVFQTGSAKTNRNKPHAHLLTFNRSDDALRAQDILTALAWLESKTGQRPELIGLEAGAVWARFAAAVAPGPVQLQAAATTFQGTDQELGAAFLVPGIQRAGGWKSALALTANQ
ncbi:MAG: acetylxylan esterase [Acidobacteriia bacterium]|nr:acetylxylan esterase [Terriglobia bacterium]